MGVAVQVAGSLAILAAFVLVQTGRWTASGVGYLWLNTVGSGVLAVDALLGRQWGFLLLEGVWCLVSAWSLLTRGRASADQGAEGTVTP